MSLASPLSMTAGLRARVDILKQALERPLATYYLMLGSAGMLLGIGLIMVLSASSVYSYEQLGSSYGIFLKQLTWVALGLPIAFVATRLPSKLVRAIAWPAVLMSIFLLLLTRTSLGLTVNGNRNWLAFGPFTMQPSEMAKLALILWSADVYARKERLLDNWKHMIVPVTPVVMSVTALVVIQHDLGTSLVLFAILLGMLWIVGAPLRIFGLSLSMISVLAFYLAVSDPVRLARMTSFLNPMANFQGTGWQTAHGLLGMASGGILGKGLGAGQQKWGNLPEAHTDFIFAVIGEELGLVGTLLVLFLFAVLAYSSIRLARSLTNPFERYVTAGVTVWLMAQMVINVGMVLALLPVIGIPLPLVSYGGSALVPSLIGIGLMLSFARRQPEAAAALRDRRRERRRGREVAGFNVAGRAHRASARRR